MSASYAKYTGLASASSSVVTIYANVAAFPVSATTGDLAVDASTGNLYEFNGAAWVQIAGPGAAISLGNLDSESASAKGANLVGGILAMQSASDTSPGIVNLTTQTFKGNKTVDGTIAASNLSGTNTGDVTLGTASGLSLVAQALSLGLSSTSTTGALSSTDWNTFNGKQASGNYITALTGDGTASGPGSAALTLATVNTNVGAFTNASVTVNAKGLVTAASSGTTGNLTDVGTDGIVITGGTGSVLGSGTSIAQHVADTTHNGYLSSTDWNTFNTKQAAGNYLTALTGDGTASGPGSSALTLATVNTNVGAFTNASVTVNAKGLVTAASSGTTGNLTEATSAVLTITGGTGSVLGSGTSILVKQAATGQSGYLSSTDWNTFNGKQAAGNYITALTGDVTASGPGSVGATLAATSNATLTTLSALTTASSLVSIGTVTSGTWSATAIALNKGGTGQTTKAAAFDALQPMTTGGDIMYGGSAGTGTRLANGSNGQVLTSAGGTSAPSWQSPGNITVVTKTTTYSIAATDGVILCSASAFTVTLPTAVSVAGEQHRIIKTDSSLSNIITVATTSSQTIGAGGGTSTTLNTQGEELTVVSDGSNWQVLSRLAPGFLQTYTPTFVGMTPTGVNIISERIGNSLHVYGGFTSASPNASIFSMTLGFQGSNNNVTSASSPITASPAVYGVAVVAQNQPAMYVIANTSSATIGLSEQAPSGGGAGLTFIAGNAIGSVAYSLNFTIPITGWN